MRLAGDRAVTHRARFEALHDAFDALHLFDRHGSLRLEVEQATQRVELLHLRVHQRGVLLEGVVIARADGFLQRVDRQRVEKVGFTFFTPLIVTAHVERMHLRVAIREATHVALDGLFGDHIDVAAFHAGGGPGEILVHHAFAKADGFKDLRTAIALHRGDADLRRDLDDALGGGLDEVINRLLVVHVHEQTLADHVVERFKGEVRIDRAAAEADQRAEVMHFARFTGLQHDVALRAGALADQMMMQTAHGQQSRDRSLFGRNAAIRQNEDVAALFDQIVRLGAKRVHRGFEALRALFRVKGDVERRGGKFAAGDAFELRELLVAEDRRLQLDQVAAFRLRIEQVALATDGRDRRRDDFLADAVNRRVRHLREELLEVVVKKLGLVRQHRDRDVGAHRAHGLHAITRHRRHEHAEVFPGVTKGLLALQHRVVVRQRRRRTVSDVGQLHQILVEPLTVRLLGGDLLFDLVVRHDAAFFHVHDEHLARLQTALELHIRRIDRQNARFRAHDHEIVVRDVVTRRTQTIAIERRAHHRAIGEGDRCRTIPRLHEAAVVFVEGLLRLAHRLVAAPRLRNHHHHRVRQRAAAQHEEFEAVVKDRRVRAVHIDDRLDLVDVIAKQLRREQRLTGEHPVDVATQRVDFAIVGDVAIRMRTLPVREGIRRETAVNQRQCRLHVRVAQVEEIATDLHRREHAFINQRAAGKARRIPHRVHFGDTDGIVSHLAQHVELPLKGKIIQRRRMTLHKHLAHQRLTRLRRFAQRRVVHRQFTPAEDRHAFRRGHFFEFRLRFGPRIATAGGEHIRHAILPLSRKLKTSRFGHFHEKLVRRLDQDARAVARVLFHAGTAMIEVLQNLQRIRHDLVRFFPLHMADKADAAGVMLIARIVETLSGGKTGVVHW